MNNATATLHVQGGIRHQLQRRGHKTLSQGNAHIGNLI